MLKHLLGLTALCSITTEFLVSGEKSPVESIAVIGVGAAGLAATKRAIEQGYKVTAYEQNEAVGGTWYYTEEVGINKYGINVHSSAHEELR